MKTSSSTSLDQSKRVSLSAHAKLRMRFYCLVVIGFLVAAIASASLPTTASATPAATDVMFVFDTSGSMGGVLGEAQEEIEAVMSQLSTTFPNVAFGVANVEDYPYYLENELQLTLTESEYEEDNEKPWRLDQAVTTEQAKVSEAIEALSSEEVAHYGGDAPEAYGRALWETDTNPNVGWRPGARHLIVLIADEVPHNPNVDEGIAEEFWAEPSPWDTGEELPGKWGIPGTQLKEGESLNFDSVLSELATDGKPLEMVDYEDTGGEYIHYWEHWAALAGGEASEASEDGHELAGKLISAVENAPEDTACATTVVPSPASPATPGGLPVAMTPRFLQPGTTISLTPQSGKVFCPGQEPALGEIVTTPSEDTSSKLAFQVPPGANSGLTLTNLSGGLGPNVPYEVDNFRHPWGFSIENTSGNGGDEPNGVGGFDKSIHVTQQDLDSVFKEIGSPGNEVYEYVKSKVESELGGLCYGFSLLSRALYDDAHGGHDSLDYTASTGLKLHAGSEPYQLGESSSGGHDLTHALLRASMSQFSPEARLAWHSVTSAASAEAQLNTAFGHDQPAVLILKYESNGKEEGHALLAYDYQKTSSGLAIDVVDPNLPWDASSATSDYEEMQLHINTHGAWTYPGTFVVGQPFGDPIGGASGSLLISPEPRTPGGLTIWYNSAAPVDTAITPAGGTAGVSISYTSMPGHGIPKDVKEGEVVDDAPSDQLLVPPSHKLITVTEHGGSGEKTYIVGHHFLDSLHTGHNGSANGQETVETSTGTLTVPKAGKEESLSVTSIAHGEQHTVTATFQGNVVKPKLKVSASGEVTLTTSGGSGKAKLKLSSYSKKGKGKARPETVKLHGHARVHRHTPKIKKHHKHKGKRHHKHKSHKHS